MRAFELKRPWIEFKCRAFRKLAAFGSRRVSRVAVSAEEGMFEFHQANDRRKIHSSLHGVLLGMRDRPEKLVAERLKLRNVETDRR